MQPLLSRYHGVFLDFTVWDNNNVYALVTFVSIAFAFVLIWMVLRQTRSHDAMRTLVQKPVPPETTDTIETDAQ